MEKLPDGKKVALITGGSRGIGAALCRAFAKEGYDIVLNYASSRERALEVEKSIQAPAECMLVQADVRNSAEVEEMFSALKQRFGRLDVLINNAGIMANSVFNFIKEDDWDRVIDTHLKGTFLCSKLAGNLMIEQRSGVIINIASISAFRPLVGQSNYAAAKGAIVTLTKALAKEYGRWHVRVNCIAPGYVETELMDNFTGEEDKRTLKQIPLRRPGKPDEVAGLAVFLASDHAGYITGETIRIDGGLSA